LHSPGFLRMSNRAPENPVAAAAENLAGFSLRPAAASDQVIIRRLVRQARINPWGLDWRRFVLAVSPSGLVAGCVQLKPHGDGAIELASLVVRPEFQGLGIGQALIRNYQEKAGSPLWLMCRKSLAPYYQGHGFRTVDQTELPRSFARLKRLFRLIAGSKRSSQLAVMVWQPD
jgi:N-acetylglutamate synthase-like GNAT family acetyltransferase